ncbi:group-specific protein [Siminovitchia acidinfaciens]|uniref:Group-specific protein n=1 Tax=Siminovitchia acidinfaciens TaxID=2321395 RepID=A0A429XWD9_9BACI|nr:group-specific protein [Siminovitchia acidinfaciens]RST72702.1 group-specific protein [Siminovitchia acidinfaciens]VEF49297.1 group-specific protein [Bacillus freudenreichii]
MSKCNIDHSREDVVGKLESQVKFLPASLAEGLGQFLQSEQPQETLNEVFHLLKKYDLASEEEKEERDQKLEEYVK